MIVEGYRAILRAVENGYPLEELFICPALFLGENERALIRRAAERAAQIVPQAVLQAAAWQGDKSGPDELPDVAGWPSPEEVARFKRQGLRFI